MKNLLSEEQIVDIVQQYIQKNKLKLGPLRKYEFLDGATSQISFGEHESWIFIYEFHEDYDDIFGDGALLLVVDAISGNIKRF